MKKKIPTFKSDKEAEAFIDTADLTEYDLSGAKPVRFEFEKKAARVNMRMPDDENRRSSGGIRSSSSFNESQQPSTQILRE